jgi:predicted esterase
MKWSLILLLALGVMSLANAQSLTAGGDDGEGVRVYSSTPLKQLRKIDDPASLFRCYPQWKEGAWRNDPVVGFWAASCGTDTGTLEYFVWAPPSYNPAKAWPLIVILHGGGSGPGTAWAARYLATHSNWYGDKPYVVIAVPAPLNNHGGWFQQKNIEAVFAAMQDTCRRFHIDRRRLYLSGHSLGSRGVVDFALAAPELFATYAVDTLSGNLPRPLPDLSGTAFILFNARVRKPLEAAGATVENHKIKAGHSIPHEKTKPLMFAFFDRHTNSHLSNLALMRERLLQKFTDTPGEKADVTAERSDYRSSESQ